MLNKYYITDGNKLFVMFSKEYRKRLWYIVPGVAIFISLIYTIGYHETPLFMVVFGILYNIVLTASLWLGCFSIVRILWRRYPWEIHPAKHLIIEIFGIFIYTNTVVFLLLYFSIHVIYKSNVEFTVAELAQNVISINLITLLITAIHEAVYFYRQWKENFSKSAKLEKDNIQAKYETLKAQINPHFLFNSLNSLTHIVDENKDAVGYIDNLSEFLRYILKSRDRELVLLRDETTMLNKYISLQKARFKENLQIVVDIDEKYFHYSVPPLVLQMLIENCVKHNVIGKDTPLVINIYTRKEYIVVENNLQLRSDAASTGQGLKNIKDRYVFFTTKDVKIVQTIDVFKVEIPLLLVEL